jgi:trans-aconitate methyltransferase
MANAIPFPKDTGPRAGGGKIVDRAKHGGKLLKRVSEEELMDVPLRARAYAEADFSEPNSKFIALFSDKFPAFNGQHILDLGCGPADITLRLAARYPQAKATGLDGSGSMLEIARKAILQHSSLAHRVDVRRWHIGQEENPLGSQAFDAVVSNSLLHHMRDPLDLWKAIRACAAPDAAVLVMDLIRPQSLVEAREIVAKYAGGETEILKVDFLKSLLAAYRPAKVMEQLASIGMDFLHIEVVSDRHFAVLGSMEASL